MKRGLAIVAVVALLALPAFGRDSSAKGNSWRDAAYCNDWYGYREWQGAGGSFIEFAEYSTLAGPFDLLTNDTVSLRVTPAATVTLDTVRTAWRSGGGGKANFNCWIESNQVAAAYHQPVLPPVQEYQGPWNIPSGNPVSGVATSYVSGATELVDFVLPSPVTLTGGQTYHIIVYVDMTQDGIGLEGYVDPVTGVIAGKARLKVKNLQPNKPYDPLYSSVKNQNNARTSDGAVLDGGTSTLLPTGQVGDDGLGTLHLLEAMWDGTPVNKWVEGQTYNNGYDDYAKYSEPWFDTLLDTQATGFGEGMDASADIAVDTTARGEQFVAQATEVVQAVAMYVRKDDINEAGDLMLALRDSAGTVLASGTRSAASIPYEWDLCADQVAYPSPANRGLAYGWVVVHLDQDVNVAAGTTYQVVATSTDGSSYKIRVQDFGATGVDLIDPLSSFQGTTGAYLDDGTGLDTNKDALFLVPEPATMSLLVLGGLAVLRRRRR